MVSTEPINQQASDMTELYELYQLQAVLDRLEKNLNLIHAVPNAQLITVVGGNLYQLAAQYYGDALQWTVIAQANNLTDPEITGLQTLLIPPPNPQNTDGIIQS